MDPSRRIIPFTHTSTRKFDFRIVINLFNVILLPLLGAASDITIGDDGDYIWDAIAITSPAVSVVWNSTAISLLLRSSLKPRYHPAIDLTFDAISWLSFWIIGSFLIAQVAAAEGLIMCSPTYAGVPNPDFCRSGGTRRWNLDVAACAFMVTNGLIHLVFFAVACGEVKRWRREQWVHKRMPFELERNDGATPSNNTSRNTSN